MIRQAHADDRPALYGICLRTGASGADASGLIEHQDLLGDVFVGPYLALEPAHCHVLDDGGVVAGYAVGTADTGAFFARAEVAWWPALRRRYAGLSGSAGLMDQWLLDWIALPPAPPVFTEEFPAHLHIDLLPSTQGGGWGRRLLDRLFDGFRTVGCPGVHLGVGRQNERAIGFYRHLGFEEIDADDHSLWMGLRFDTTPS